MVGAHTGPGTARTGHIAPGLDADLLVVRGDPLADLGALADVVAVYRRGRLVSLDPARLGAGPAAVVDTLNGAWADALHTPGPSTSEHR